MTIGCSVLCSLGVVIALVQQPPPEVRFVPLQLALHADSTGFAVGTLQVLNRGGTPLQIRRVVPSCQCAAATVQKNPVYPLEVGTVLIRINTRGLRDSVATVEFAFETNAQPELLRYEVVVHQSR